MALGSNASGIVALVLRETAWLLAIGLAAGLVLSIAAARTAATFLFGLSSDDGIAVRVTRT